MNEKPEFTGAIGDDPFANMAPESLRELGIDEAVPEEEVQSEAPPTDEEKAVASIPIPIEDEADMALARWLYLEEPMTDTTVEDSAPQDWLDDLLLNETEAPQVPDEET